MVGSSPTSGHFFFLCTILIDWKLSSPVPHKGLFNITPFLFALNINPNASHAPAAQERFQCQEFLVPAYTVCNVAVTHLSISSLCMQAHCLQTSSAVSQDTTTTPYFSLFLLLVLSSVLSILHGQNQRACRDGVHT